MAQFGFDALKWALIVPNTQDNCVEMVRLLLRAGARVDTIGDQGFTALHVAAYGWNLPLDVFDVMIERMAGNISLLDKQLRVRKATSRIFFRTVWHIAHWVIKWKGKSRAHYFLYKVYLMCHVTAMHLAARRGDCEVFARLLKAGCDPEKPSSASITPTFLLTSRTFGVSDLSRFVDTSKLM